MKKSVRKVYAKFPCNILRQIGQNAKGKEGRREGEWEKIARNTCRLKLLAQYMSF